MFVSNKNKKLQTNRFSKAAMQAGYLLLAGIATIGMTDMPDHLSGRIIIPNQPAFALANNGSEFNGQGNSMRREREDLESHYISYSVVQRTAGRTGKR
jgi:hypothetical protein